MSNNEFAKNELELAGWFSKEDIYAGMIGESVMELLETFDKQGHSGMSASITLTLFERLVRGKPLSPLNGEDDEWNEYKDGCFQNKRCSTIFKDGKDGQAYNIEGKLFSDNGGKTWYGCSDSRVYIDFPYVVPDHPEKVLIDKDGK